MKPSRIDNPHPSIEGTILLDDKRIVYCENVLLPYEYIKFVGCRCKIIRIEENNKKQSHNKYPYFCFCPEWIDCSITGTVEIDDSGNYHCNNYLLNSKQGIELGQEIIITRIAPRLNDPNYLGRILRYEQPISIAPTNEPGGGNISNINVFYLADTNVFIDCPDILKQISDNDRLLVVNHVIFELDGLKKKKEIGTQARSALKYIHDYSAYIEFATTEEPYKPFESPCSPDQKILATVFLKKFLNANVIVVTSDIGMIDIAKAYNIPAMTLEDFLAKNDKTSHRKKKISWKAIIGGLGIAAISIISLSIGIWIGRKKN